MNISVRISACPIDQALTSSALPMPVCGSKRAQTTRPPIGFPQRACADFSPWKEYGEGGHGSAWRVSEFDGRRHLYGYYNCRSRSKSLLHRFASFRLRIVGEKEVRGSSSEASSGVSLRRRRRRFDRRLLANDARSGEGKSSGEDPSDLFRLCSLFPLFVFAFLFFVSYASLKTWRLG
ncbi:hypothetical protein U1Q18_052406 [Sarracenia purpurea var. burkii]